MKGHERRVRAIELTLTPQQIVLVWLRNALQVETLKEAARHSPPHRGVIANSVYDCVRNCMKSQPEALVERAVRQARREADLLYMLVVGANMAVHERMVKLHREYVLSLGYLGAVLNGKNTKDRIEDLRLAVLMVIEPVIVLDAAIAQLVTEQLSDEAVLFRDVAVKLAEQLKIARDLSNWFNVLAVEVGATEIDLGQLRKGLQPEIERQVAIWVSCARVEMLNLFGTIEEMHAAMDHTLFLGELTSERGISACANKVDSSF